MSALDKLKATIKASRRVANIDRRADFSMADAGLDSIFANLLTTQQGVARSLGSTNDRILSGMERLSDKGAAQSKRGVARAGARALNLFGSALGGVVEQNLGPAEAIAAATAAQGKAAVGAGKLAAKGASTALDIQESAASEAQAGADYQLAQALGYRAKSDAALVAQQQTALAEMRFQQAQERQARREASKPGGETFQAASGEVLNLAMDPNATLDTVLNTAKALEMTYNLKPGTLQSYAQSLFDSNGVSTVAQALTDSEGNVIATHIDQEDTAAIPAAVLAWLKNHSESRTPDQSKENFLASLVQQDPDTGAYSVNGQVVTSQYVNELRDAAATQWDAVAPSFFGAGTQMDTSAANTQNAFENPASRWVASQVGLDDGEWDLDTWLKLPLLALTVESGIGAAVGATSAAAGALGAGKLAVGKAALGGAFKGALKPGAALASATGTSLGFVGGSRAAAAVAESVSPEAGQLVANLEKAVGTPVLEDLAALNAPSRVASGATQAAASTWDDVAAHATAMNELHALDAATVSSNSARSLVNAVSTQAARGALSATQQTAVQDLLKFIIDPEHYEEWKKLVELMGKASIPVPGA